MVFCTVAVALCAVVTVTTAVDLSSPTDGTLIDAGNLWGTYEINQTWNIDISPAVGGIFFSFVRFNVPDDGTTLCLSDYLEVYDATSDTSLRLCGTFTESDASTITQYEEFTATAYTISRHFVFFVQSPVINLTLITSPNSTASFSMWYWTDSCSQYTTSTDCLYGTASCSAFCYDIDYTNNNYCWKGKPKYNSTFSVINDKGYGDCQITYLNTTSSTGSGRTYTLSSGAVAAIVISILVFFVLISICACACCCPTCLPACLICLAASHKSPKPVALQSPSSQPGGGIVSTSIPPTAYSGGPKPAPQVQYVVVQAPGAYGAPAGAYGAPPGAYGAAPGPYGAQPAYAAPPGGYGGYTAPPGGYSQGYAAPPGGYAAPPNDELGAPKGAPGGEDIPSYPTGIPNAPRDSEPPPFDPNAAGTKP